MDASQVSLRLVWSCYLSLSGQDAPNISNGNGMYVHLRYAVRLAIECVLNVVNVTIELQ